MLKKKFAKDKCVTCKQCMIACAVRQSLSKDIYKAFSENPTPQYRIKIVTRKGKPHSIVCQNCAKPKCKEACEYNAITKYEDGNVVIDQETCVGCWACVDVCPFGAIFKDEVQSAALNCDDCRYYSGMACVEACKTEALIYAEQPAVVTSPL